jgi:hypothetical protein
MRIDATTPVQDVLAAYPDAADVLDWYGVDPEELTGQTLTVRELCKTFDVELEEMLTDLQALADEDEEGDDDEDDEDEEGDDDEDDEDDDDDDDEDDEDGDDDEDEDEDDEDGDDDDDEDDEDEDDLDD